MNPTPKLIKTTVPAVVALLALAGCSGPGVGGASPSPSPTPDGSAAPAVTLAVPETSTAGERVQVVVESSGLDGTKATLYQFAGKFTDKPPTCRDEEMKQTEVTLTSGPQAVDVSNETPGDIWFLLQAGELVTDCGATGSVTRAMLTPRGELRIEDEAEAEAEAGTFTYFTGVDPAPPKPVEEWELTTTWYGPYATVPAAEAAECSAEEQAETRSAKITKASGPYGDDQTKLSVDLADPGVYRVGWSVAETPWSVQTGTTCDEGSLVNVR